MTSRPEVARDGVTEQCHLSNIGIVIASSSSSSREGGMAIRRCSTDASAQPARRDATPRDGRACLPSWQINFSNLERI